MQTEVLEFINKNLPLCIKKANWTNKPFTVPCVGEGFVDFYYWDTFFANLGLLEIDINQAKNNISVFRHFVRQFGFVPNADNILDRSQPPLYARAVYDYYMKTGDLNEVRKNYNYLLKEYKFWMTKRITDIGLNRWYNNSDDSVCEGFFQGVLDYRLSNMVFDKNVDKVKEGRNFLAIAESGWDFNPRYKTDYSQVACVDFVSVDLNSYLYDVEKKLSFFSALLGKPTNQKKFAKLSEKRKSLMNKYMKAQDGIYYDYNFVTGKKSEVLSVASIIPYSMAIDNNIVALKQILERLKGKYGIFTCEKREDCKEKLFQWDYPNMWPPMIYFVIEACLQNSLYYMAYDIAKMFIDLVNDVFEETGNLWEKYDANINKVAECPEYDTPAMLGWTAGVYIYCKNFLNCSELKDS